MFLKSIIIFLCSFSMAFPVGGFSNVHSDTLYREKGQSKPLLEATLQNEERLFNESGDGIVPLLQSSIFENGQTLKTDFKVSSESGIANVYYENDGFEIVSAPVLKMVPEKLISVALRHIPSYEQCKFTIFVELDNGNTVYTNLYGVSNKSGLFISPNSFDDAIEQYYALMLSNGEMTAQKIDELRNIYYKKGITENICAIADNGGRQALRSYGASLRGRLTWRDDNGRVHPLQFTKIYFSDLPIDPSFTTYTDVNGDYSASFSVSGFSQSISMSIYAAGSNVSVVRPDDETQYSINIQVGVTPLYIGVVDEEFDMSTDLGQAMQISQAAITGARYAKAVSGRNMSDVKIVYPYSTNNRTCYYDPPEKGIYITGVTAHVGSPKSYACWDVIMHEYGHHVQYEYEIIKNRTSGLHSHTYNIADQYLTGQYAGVLNKSNCKEFAVSLAWGEAWPTVFGAMAQQYYIADLSNIDTVGDRKYSDYMSADFDFIDGNIRLGEMSEWAIMGVLWCLYDNVNKSYDTISLSHQTLWNIVTGSKSKTFSDFANSFYSRQPSKIFQFGQIMAYFRMSPSDLINTAPITNSPPTFKWTANGGTAHYPNDSYYLIFYYAGSTTEITRTINITSISATPQYTLDSGEWNRVLNGISGFRFSVAVIAYQTDGPQTGGYLSGQLTF